MISSRPMNTPTLDSTGALCIGRIRMRSISTPMMKDATMVMKNAIQ